MKYIIFKSHEGPRVEIFAAPTTHADQAAAHPVWKPISAGFVEFLGAGDVRCFGFSESLDLRPDQHDSSLIEVMMSATLRTCAASPIPA
jgi:hypothetical protein